MGPRFSCTLAEQVAAVWIGDRSYLEALLLTFASQARAGATCSPKAFFRDPAGMLPGMAIQHLKHNSAL